MKTLQKKLRTIPYTINISKPMLDAGTVMWLNEEMSETLGYAFGELDELDKKTIPKNEK